MQYTKKTTRTAVIAGLAVAAIVGLSLIPADAWDDIWIGGGSILLIALLALGYFLPTVVALARKHHSAPAVIAVNVLLGWTFLGWVVALVWSLTDPSPTARIQQVQSAPPVQYQVGDVVNGHRYNGNTWEQVA